MGIVYLTMLNSLSDNSYIIENLSSLKVNWKIVS
jgi:hypothetical protein